MYYFSVDHKLVKKLKSSQPVRVQAGTYVTFAYIIRKFYFYSACRDQCVLLQIQSTTNQQKQPAHDSIEINHHHGRRRNAVKFELERTRSSSSEEMNFLKLDVIGKFIIPHSNSGFIEAWNQFVSTWMQFKICLSI